ncbi:hypothetical protein [Microbacterium sp. KRD172]|uniref:hypothetical protein n=1 Tax=Microbacterium TaxID=33882 RepID=UPI0035A86F46
MALTGATLLIEDTSWQLLPSDDPRAWTFGTRTTLRALDEPVELGSPGTHGRVGGGYGGSPGGSPPPHTSNGSSVTLSFRGAVADGRLTDAEVVALLGTAS